MAGVQETWVTGIGLVSSLGEGASAHGRTLSRALPEKTLVDADNFKPYCVHPLIPTDLSIQIPSKSDLRQMGRWQQIGTYAAGLALADQGHVSIEFAGSSKHVSCMLDRQRSCCSQGRAASATVKKPDFVFGFERLDASAQGWLRNALLFGSKGKAAGSRHGKDVPQSGQTYMHAVKVSYKKIKCIRRSRLAPLVPRFSDGGGYGCQDLHCVDHGRRHHCASGRGIRRPA